MAFKSIDFVGLCSGIVAAVSVVGAAVLTFGPWGAQQGGQTAYAILMVASLAFWMISEMASGVTKILEEQADHIAALQRQLAEK